jgi:transposase
MRSFRYNFAIQVLVRHPLALLGVSDLLFLPPKSPKLQPVERLWTLTNEAIANRSFTSLNELEAVTSHRCQVLLNRRELIQGLTNYHWWTEAVD